MRRLLAIAALCLVSAAPTPGITETTLPRVDAAQIVARYPHDITAFTEGLLWLDGRLYESTGLEGRSLIRIVRLEDGKTLKQARLAARYFGEGIVNWGKRLYSLTWKDGTGFIWDARRLRQTGRFSYSGEGWGLTQNGRHIIMSDGTSMLRFLDPATLKPVRTLSVTHNGAPLGNINELEWVKGEIYANIWMASVIARIDPDTGRVTGWIDVMPLLAEAGGDNWNKVANGIAYDEKRDRLFVTGKNWSILYEIRRPTR